MQVVKDAGDLFACMAFELESDHEAEGDEVDGQETGAIMSRTEDRIHLGDEHTWMEERKGDEIGISAMETATLSMVMNVNSDIKNLFVINHWLYFGNETYSNLYRLHPDTNMIETDFWSV